MNASKDQGASDADKSAQSDVSNQLNELLPAASLEGSIVQRESAVIEDEAAVLSREKLATAREDAAHVRENAADMREDAAHLREGAAQAREGDARVREVAATLREQDIRTAKTFRTGTADDQIAMLQQANANLVIASIDAHKLTEQVEMARVQLDHLAHHDVLTDLPNRMLLQDRLGQAIEVARRQGRQLAVMYMDLDRFKHINDSLGHAVGDQLLKSVALRLVACVRQSDTVSRQGGDEFVVLLPFIEHAEDAALSAQKMLMALALPHRIDGQELHIGVSIGMSIYPNDGIDAPTLIKCADTAMYHAKENGRNNFKFFEPDMNARAVQRQSTEASLRLALERQEFVLYYQPKINLQSGRIVGVEALIRWQHPERGLLSPAQFVAIAEECGLILPIGRWVLREACLQAQAWLRSGLPPITVAVNTSAVEFRAKDFLDNVRTTLEDTQFEPRYLELELTESVLMRDSEFTGALLQSIADLGVKLAIDDFGTGYSSLSYLSRFPINTLKIDQSFVTQMNGNPDDAVIVSAVISMGKSLKQRVIAEGVETPEQYAFLRAQNCDEGQGYYFGRPVPAQILATLLQHEVA
ncbi:putative bifunctional diguanylate cyclase/phosphodiesterase [Rhodoferax ferrireducens]|uniref:putative bifunctional diguanylate cyclase/phosphodiesterase n=1 Tax=Rhodoferax ferrireducens TaxID=192843 RepID=UPI000E0D5D71|nr:EAL domain-containing protein [Rhodoferax ferrireducens]